MSDPLNEILGQPEDVRKQKGTWFTPTEIAQQPAMWRDTVGRMHARRDELVALFDGVGYVVLAGAGTSDFIGGSVAGLMQDRLGIPVRAVPTTDIVTHPEQAFLKDEPTVLVSFARSGRTPESLETVRIARDFYPNVRQLIVTCSEHGTLARMGHELRDRAVVVTLHPATNDGGLAMTSSFSSMVVAGQYLAYLDEGEDFLKMIDQLAESAEKFMPKAADAAAAVVKSGFSRGCFLGSSGLTGAATESHLKVQEMTDGAVMCMADTFVGFRHGPQAVSGHDALLVYFLSSDPHARAYEMDLVRENRTKGLGVASIAVTAATDNELDGLVNHVLEFDPDGVFDIADGLRPPLDVTVGQLLGLFTSLAHGLSPDEPSRAGVINRVVEGVTVHPYSP